MVGAVQHKMMGRAAAALSVALNTTVASKTVPGGGTGTTNTVTGTVSGGTAPFTYAWNLTSAYPITILSPTAASTAFRATVDDTETFTGTAVLTVTDAAAQVVNSQTVNVTIKGRLIDLGDT